MNYLDFELEIGVGDGQTYPVAVLRSPAGEARERVNFPFGALELENRLQALQIALLRTGDIRRMALTPDQHAVQSFGRALFDMLLFSEVRSRYDVSLREAALQGKGLRIKLRVQSPELAALPWEFIYDPRNAEYVCLSRNTPLVRYLELPQPVQPLRAELPLRILGMAVSPEGMPPLDIAQEKERVETALEGLRAAGLVSLTWLAGQTWRDLQRELRHGPWHIFHFIGHGGFDRAADEGFVALADQSGAAHHLSATQLGRLLADHRDLRLALLNACEGARGSAQDIFSGAAAILVRRGLPAVLAMQYPITDRAAIEFSRTFYEALADGLPVDTAATEARQAISYAAPHSVEWGIPVLYMRAADGVLFDVRAGREKRIPVTEVAVSDLPDVAPDERAVVLHTLLVKHFDLQELRVLCFHLGVDDEQFPDEGKSGKVQRLLEYLVRRNQIDRLIEVGRKERPDVPWDTAVAAVREAAPPGRAPAPLSDASGAPVLPIAPDTPRGADAPTAPLLDVELVYIPAGDFMMGSDPQQGELVQADERPQHTLALPEYYLARTPVTNRQYLAFVHAREYRRPALWPSDEFPEDKADHPVVHVSWYDAMAYCAWLTERLAAEAHQANVWRAGKWEKVVFNGEWRCRLPSEAEWEKGARGTDGRLYPWGNVWDVKRCNTKESRSVNATPVDAYPSGASPYGVLDVAGNVWEWTRTNWGMDTLKPQFSYPYVPGDGREDEEATEAMYRVLRGGSFNYGREYARCTCRSRLLPNNDVWYVGFRVALLAT